MTALPDPDSVTRDHGTPAPATPRAEVVAEPLRPRDPAPPIDLRQEAGPGVIATGHRDDHGPARDVPPAEHGGRGPDLDIGAIGTVASCTAPQLRRFIKSRPYVPMHELRRRFGINGTEDDVSSIDLGRHRVYVGLPPREGSLLGELLRGGDIGYELSLDPRTPIVIGLYPMRPVART
jgi:hypothetical protein